MHPSNCATANGEKCACRCGGSQHGEGHLRHAMISTLDALSQEFDSSTENYRQDKFSDDTSKARRQLLNRAILAGVRLYLGGDRELLALTQEVADKLAEGVSSALASELGQDRVRTLPTTHFWCSLLTAIVMALSEIDGLWEKISHTVRDAVIAKLEEGALFKSRSKAVKWLTSTYVRLMVRVLWKKVDAAVTLTTGTKQFQQILRILALISCPNLSRHPEVIKYCFKPIFDAVIKPEIKREFEEWIKEAYPAVFANDQTFAKRLNDSF